MGIERREVRDLDLCSDFYSEREMLMVKRYEQTKPVPFHREIVEIRGSCVGDSLSRARIQLRREPLYIFL